MHDGTAPSADGMAFVIQSDSPNALGGTGGGLGFGSDTPNGQVFIPNSIAIKFDLYSNAGEGINSTGLFTSGASPTVGVNPGDVSIDLTGTGIDLHSQDVFQVTLTYDGTTLTETIKDTNTGATFNHSYTVDIGTQVGSLGYVGFTGGTGGLTTVADVQTWTYQFTEPGPGQGGGAVAPAAVLGTGSPAAPVLGGLSIPQELPSESTATQLAGLPGSPGSVLGGVPPYQDSPPVQDPYGLSNQIDPLFGSPDLLDTLTPHGTGNGPDGLGNLTFGGGNHNPLADGNVLDQVFQGDV
jgi:hypothetical protein